MARLRPGPRPLDQYVWVQKIVDGQLRQARIPRSGLPSLSPNWERIADPFKSAAASDEATESAPAAKKPAKKQPSTSAEPAPEKE